MENQALPRKNIQNTANPQKNIVDVTTPTPNPLKNTHFNKKWIILALVLLVLISVAGTVSSIFLNEKRQAACTQEAKLCPNGSSVVGRTGPKCEFAKCPEITQSPDPTVNWKTYENREYNFSFKYPTNLTVKLEKSIQTFPNCHDESISHTYNDYKFTTGHTVNGNEDYWGFGVIVMQTNNRTIKQEYEDCPFNGSKMHVINLTETDGTDEAATIEVNGIVSGIIKIYRIGNKFFYLTNFQNELLPPDQKDQTPASVRQQIISTFKFTHQPSPTPTCTPRPKCLDAIPRCEISETADMCPPVIKACSALAWKNSEGKICGFSTPNCDIVCK